MRIKGRGFHSRGRVSRKFQGSFYSEGPKIHIMPMVNVS